MKIEGHYQFTGSGYKFFETIQPGLSCEDPINHGSCKSMSAKRNAEMTEAEKAERHAKKEADKAEVEKAAQQRAEEEAQALRNKAGVAKHDARRNAGRKLIDRQDKAKSHAADLLVKAKAIYDASVADVNAALEKELAAAQHERDEAEAKIEATDWLAAVSPKVKPHDADPNPEGNK